MFEAVFGVDFSGAAQAGRNTWVAELRPGGHRRWVLADLWNLADAAGTAERGPALSYLVRRVARSRRALWAFDFPFGFPVEVVPPGATWLDQLAWVEGWTEGAYALGVTCVEKALRQTGRLHIRRRTDADEKAPFDPFHYRVIYQTFHGMRDVLGPLVPHATTAILPFQYDRLRSARRVLVETCTTSVLDALGMPSENYKQPGGGPVRPLQRRVRRTILVGLGGYVAVPPRLRAILLGNPGGDALDALVAAVGAARAWATTDHAAVAGDARYPREGRQFVRVG